MTPWSLSSRRRHSFMPSSPSAVRPDILEQPNSPDTIVPTVTDAEELPGRESVVSLDRHHRKEEEEDKEREERQETGMLSIPNDLSRSATTKRFSQMLRFRKSDSQINKTTMQHAETTPPVPPTIMRTAPTQDNFDVSKRRSTFLLPLRPKTPKRQGKSPVKSDGPGTPRSTFDGGDGPSHDIRGPPSYGDVADTQLAVPVNRASDSSRSDGSSGDGTIYGQTTTVTHTTHTTTTFFKLPRRKKDKGPLFPLPPRSSVSTPGTGTTPNLAPAGFGNSGRSSFSHPDDISTPTGSPRRSIQHSPSRSTPNATPALGRSDSRLSAHSAQSGRGLQVRGRSSTAGSARRLRRDGDGGPTPPIPTSGRTSTSTAGRPSLAGLFNMSRLRQASEPALRNGNSVPGTPMSAESNPFTAAPKTPSIALPHREEGDTAVKYLSRLEDVLTRGALVPVISKTDDEFMKNVLRSYMRRFKFFEEPIDMAVRKLLMQIELPKETQQIDRTLQAFADRYHECNPGVFQNADEAYFIAFSILILHTDVFNKNNKRKMQKVDYLKNTQSQGVAPEILGCFYDNVAYTPFIHLDDDTEFIAEKLITKRRNGLGKSASTTALSRQNSPVDPYALILEGKLDVLRVPVEEVVAMDDPFGYLGTAKILNHAEMRRAFYRNGIIQIVSSRSRPDAFAKESTIQNPFEAQVGVVDMKITKVGVLWRKDPKKRKTRGPWQEWGVILTGSQLYFFRNRDWVKSLMHQYDHHLRSGKGKTACVFKPAITDFKPDFLISTEGMVALVDAQYRRHKNAFVISRENIFQEVFLADNESELNDWLAKLNYSAAFRTTGVRMRGLAGSSAESQGSSEVTPPARPHTDSAVSSSASVGLSSPIPAAREAANQELTRQIAQARRQFLRTKLEEMEDKLVAIDKLLDAQLRTARHLSVLTPIQERTRSDVLTAAARLAANIRWERMKRWRVKSHREILHIDLDEDLKQEARGHELDLEEPAAPGKNRTDRPRLGFSRLTSKAGSATTKTNSKEDRATITSPNATAKFIGTVEDMFKAPSRTDSAKHQAKGSWELPPLAFDRRGSTATGVTNQTNNTAPESISTSDVPEIESKLPEAIAGSIGSASSVDLPSTPPNAADAVDDSPGGLRLPPSANSETTLDNDDAISTTDTEHGSTPRPKRHSLTKRLHSGSGPHFQRHRKHRGSSSTAGASDTDGPSTLTPDEGLLRSPGSFTLHGKKASVVTFGSEWQKLGGEDGIRARKMTITDDAAAKAALEKFSKENAGDDATAKNGNEEEDDEEEAVEFQDAPDTPEIQLNAKPVGDTEGNCGAAATKAKAAIVE